MAKIDISDWKEFRLDSVFIMRNTKSIVQKDVTPDSGNTPYVTAQAGNNGVLMYVDCPQEWIDDGDCIMIGGKTMTFSYQAAPFCSNDSHNIALYLKDKEQATEMSYLFLITALRTALYSRYSWGDSISMKRIKDESFYLPVTTDGKPDYVFMDSYMCKIIEESETSLERLRQADKTKTTVDTVGWKEFWLRDLFKFKLPQGDLQVKRVQDGDIPLITPSAFNNGLLQRVSSESESTLFSANTLTVDMFGNAYYQEEDYFVTAHGHVNVLIPKMPLNKNSGMFIATAIRSMFLKKYGFSEMCTLKVLRGEKVMLPVTSNGIPDWDYMDKYMSEMLDIASTSLNMLTGAAS